MLIVYHDMMLFRACAAIAAVADRNPPCQNIFYQMLDAGSIADKAASSATGLVNATTVGHLPTIHEASISTKSLRPASGNYVQITARTNIEKSAIMNEDINVFQLLVSVLQNHRSNSGVCVQASRCARYLSYGNAAIRVEFTTCGVVPAAFKALKSHKTTDFIVENCAWILASVVAPDIVPQDPLTNAIMFSPEPTTGCKCYSHTSLLYCHF
jgi:hypothetical protein